VKIILASDGSAGAEAALETIIGSFRPGETQVEVLVVADVRPAEDPLQVGVHDDAQAASAIADQACRRLEMAGFTATTLVLSGRPADRIIEHRDGTDARLLVLGRHGADRDDGGSVGFVASSVARHATGAVLLVGSRDPIHRLVLGYDGSPESDLLIDVVAELPLREVTATTVCTAYDILAPLYGSTDDGPGPTAIPGAADQLSVARAHAHAVAEAGARRSTAKGRPAVVCVEHGRPSQRLAAVLAGVGGQLLGVGSRGLAGMDRLLVGSTSDALIDRSPGDLLIVRSHRA
jgi:nucleotide-binding universal stress UspA family protein